MVAHTKCFHGVHNYMGKEVPLASWQSLHTRMLFWILIWVSISNDKELVTVISCVFQMAWMWNLAISCEVLSLGLCHMSVKMSQITANSVVSGDHVNLFAPGWFEWNFRKIIIKLIIPPLQPNLAISCEDLSLGLCHMSVKIPQITANSLVSRYHVKLLALGWFEWNFGKIIFKLILKTYGWGISCEIALGECFGTSLMIDQHLFR